MSLHPQEKTLLRLLVHQPEQLSRNRNFALFQHPRAAHLRKRAAHLRAIAEHLQTLEPAQVEVSQQAATTTFRFELSEDARRIAIVDQEELDILAEDEKVRQHPRLATLLRSADHTHAQPTDPHG